MSFADLGLLTPLVASLTQAGLSTPTPVQRMAVPALLGGASIVCVARTGSGKTLAYSLPLLQRLNEIEAEEGLVKARGRPRALVLTATRELVEQTARVLKAHAHALRARVRAASGGFTERGQRLQLVEPCDVLVANPPRLVAILKAGAVHLEDVRVLIVDEADTLLSPGERGDVEKLLTALPAQHTVAFFSATLPEPIRAWVVARPQHPVLLLSKDAHSAPESLTIQNVRVHGPDRSDSVHDALVSMAPSLRGVLFCNRRETADLVGATLRDRNHSVIVIHGGLPPENRRLALKAFRAGEGRVLVTTELAGRGLHLEGLTFVLNYDLPEKASEYLHRIGRVGRQGAPGKVINLVGPDDATLLKQIERLKAGGRLDTGESLRAPRERRAPPPKPDPRARGGGRPGGAKEPGRGPPKGAPRGGAAKGAGPKGAPKGEGPKGAEPKGGALRGAGGRGAGGKGVARPKTKRRG